jgi:uncharacterized membrane protein
MPTILNGKKHLTQHWPLAFIVLFGFLMRLKGLTFQSLWLDELHTMNGLSPKMSWSQMFTYMKGSEQQPPLYFVLMKIVFSWFGHTEFVARFISALAGTISIWAMYKLGKEILNRELGLVAALLTCVNYYNLFYSQEARPYILAFLFATLSFTWFIRLLRSPTRKHAIIYSIFTLLFLYTHYYSLFAVTAQVLIALIFIFLEKGKERNLVFKNFFFAGILLALGYAPWLPQLLGVSQIKSTWIQLPPLDFISSYFYGFFGNAAILNSLLILLLIIYFVCVAREQNIGSARNNPLLLSFIICTVWIFVTVLIPYLRSLMVIPMLIPRYTIIVLPAILLLLSYGIILFRHNLTRYIVLALLVVLSFLQLFLVQHYYSTPIKTQFREMTRYVVKENKNNYPILNERTHWHQQYYLDHFGSRASTFTGKKEAMIDSILSGSSTYSFKGFWLVGAHGDLKPDSNKISQLDTAWVRVKEKEFNDSWAMLFVPKKDNMLFMVRFTELEGGEDFYGIYRVIWNGSAQTKRLEIPPGNYRITLDGKGDMGGGAFPHVNVCVNGRKVYDFVWEGEKAIHFETMINDPQTIIKIEMDNDFSEPGKGDRNVFVKNLMLERID